MENNQTNTFCTFQAMILGEICSGTGLNMGIYHRCQAETRISKNATFQDMEKTKYLSKLILWLYLWSDTCVIRLSKHFYQNQAQMQALTLTLTLTAMIYGKKVNIWR